jgi:AraC family transcriptional regulator
MSDNPFAMDKALPARYEGDFLAWNGGCVLIGSSAGPPIAPHSHYAIQLAVGAPAGLRVQFGRNAPWQPCAAALFPSRATHSIDVSGCEWSAVIFVEPETVQGRALKARLGGRCEIIAAEHVVPALATMESAWRRQGDAEALRAACVGLVGQLARAAQQPDVSDPRVIEAVEYIRSHVDQPVSLEEVARVVHLSPGRFRHLFVEQTGMPLRTYALWRRLLFVWERLMEGETLSGAAHTAGFADSAHLSRTARNMFGLPPSAMQMTGPLSARMRSPRRQFG